MISVIIPLYNKRLQVVNTLHTVLVQTWQDFEIVIVDDGSTDGSIDVVKGIKDSRIRIFRQANAGVSAARNRGIKEARGDLIAFLDADDEWKEDYLSTQMSLVEKYPQCDVFVTNYEFRNSKGKITPTVIRKLPFNAETGELTNYFEVASYSHPPICSISIMVRKSAILSVGGFPEGVKSGEDLLTWALLAVRYKIAYCKRSLAVFIHDEDLFNDDQRKRAPGTTDIVGQELEKLYLANKSTLGIKNYLALWHKMRTRILIQKGNRKHAFKECVKSMRYCLNIKIVVFMVLVILPYRFSNYIFNKLG